MKNVIASILAAGSMALGMGTAHAQPNVGVSIGVNQPGVYGRIDIGNLPPPALVLPQPVVVMPPPGMVVDRRPIYLYVPPAHQRDWRHHCNRYGACGQPVYFVRDDWVRERYEREHPGRQRGWDKPDRHNRHDRDDRNERNGRGHGGKPDRHDN